jgi:putative heme-binding domain-containing protein
LARLHALCTLDGLDAVEDILIQLLADAHPGVRRHAVRIAERYFNSSREMAAAAAKLADDPDPQVRLQLACSIGAWDSPEAGNALASLAATNNEDKFIMSAVLSSLTRRNLTVMTHQFVPNGSGLPPRALLEPLVRTAAGFEDQKTISGFLSLVMAGPDVVREIGGINVGRFKGVAMVLDALDATAVSLETLEEDVRHVFDEARTIARDEKLTHERIQAMALLGRERSKRAEDAALMASMLVPQTPQEVQEAAIKSLARMRHEELPAVLLRGWKGHSLAVRNQILDVLLGRNEWAVVLVDALEQSKIASADVDASRRQRLLQNGSKAIRERAKKIFADAINPDRQKVLDAYSAALTAAGDSKRGGEVFTKSCATCHKVGAIGQNVGPDIGGIADKSPQSLLIAMVDPNRAVEAKFTNFVAETRADEVITGIISSEAGESLTMISADGKPREILRSQLKSLRSTGTSLMPENLESGYTPQDLADLIAFIRAANPPVRKKFEGNNPEVVRANAAKMLRLTPANCEIYGSSVVLEKQHGNLGYWTSEDDQAVWTMEVSAAGKYGVWLEWACAADSAGNAYLLEIGRHRVTGRIASTGNWDTYHRTQIGELELEAGKYQVIFRSAGEIVGALVDLKSIELVPPMKRDF